MFEVERYVDPYFEALFETLVVKQKRIEGCVIYAFMGAPDGTEFSGTTIGTIRRSEACEVKRV